MLSGSVWWTGCGACVSSLDAKGRCLCDQCGRKSMVLIGWVHV